MLFLVCPLTQPDPSLSGLAAMDDGWKGTDIEAAGLSHTYEADRHQ